MRNFKITALAVLFLAIAFTASALAVEPTIVEAKIKTSAVCGMCKTTIEKAVKKLSGIEKAELKVADKMLTVKYNSDKVTKEEIMKAVTRAGYDADDKPKDKRAWAKLPACCKGEAPHETTK